jgi:hypothetical protein
VSGSRRPARLVEWGRNRIALTLRNDRDHSKAREIAGIIAQLFEAQQRYVPDPHDKELSADYSLKQPPKHTFGREKRSLGNSDKRKAIRQSNARPQKRQA